MLSMTRDSKPGHWQTVGAKDKKKKQEEKKDVKKDRLGVAIDPTAAAFAAFDKAFTDKTAAEKQKQEQTYKGAFAGLVDEAPPQAVHDEDGASSSDESATKKPVVAAAAPAKPKAPKAPKKPKLTVQKVAEGIRVDDFQKWLSEVQQRYSTNEKAQLEAVCDKLLGLFKEASLDIAKTLATQGLGMAGCEPYEHDNTGLFTVVEDFVASVDEDALAAMTVPLVAAVISEATGGPTGTAPVGKGKAGLYIMLAAILNARPQVLVRAAPELRAAGRQLTGVGRMPILLWVMDRACFGHPEVGVAVWVRLLLPQLLGLPELPGCASKSSKVTVTVIPAGLADDLLRPLEPSLQSAAVDFLHHIFDRFERLNCAYSDSGDIVCGDGEVVPTVPGSAVELVSRLVAGRAVVPALPAAAAAAADSKKAAAARAAAAAGLAPYLPGLTALAASTSCLRQYSDWLLLALDSAAQSSADVTTPDELVQRSASNVVACICGSNACFALWESKHKGSLRGSARILAAMLQQPQLLQPLQQQPDAAEAFRELLAALPARHRTHLQTGKGWQGACARVAEDACQKLPKKLSGRGWRSGKAGKDSAAGSSSRKSGALGVILGATTAFAGVVIMAALYRREVAGIVQAYAGKDVAEQVDGQVLAPIETAIEQLQKTVAPHLSTLQEIAAPHIKQARAAAAPLLNQAWEVVGPLATQVQMQVVSPALRELTYASQQLQEMLERAKNQ